ncbi:MAG: exodeoxyribonuclease VII small subunit [Bacteroidota bacterium]
MENQPTYKSALAELRQIVNDLEHELVDIDELSEKVKRAKALLDFCRTRIKKSMDDLAEEDKTLKDF